MAVIVNGRVLLPEGIIKRANIYFENGVIKSLRDDINGDENEVFDAKDSIVAPGFVDIHIHGAYGSDFSDGSTEEIDRISEYLLRQGVTAFLGTTMSLDEEKLNKVMDSAAPLIGMTRQGKAVLWGINMEGPFIAMSKKGGQNGSYIIDPDIKMFMRLYRRSKGSIKLIDIAPELPGSMEFIEQVKGLANISLAHTETDYETAKRAFARGASHITHLFNAMPPINHRNPGIIIAAAEAAKYVEIICDGNHIHPAMIRFIFQVFGSSRVCIVSDSMRACGLKDGEYDLGGQTVYVNGDIATLTDGTLAGSTTNIAEGMRRAVSYGVPVEEALTAVTRNPAKAVGLDEEIGRLAPGCRANIVILDERLNVKSVFLEGRLQLGTAAERRLL